MALIVDSLYFFLPAYFANMAPVLFKWIPFADQPIHRKLLGKNKTWRGVLAAVILGTVVFLLQKLSYQWGFTSFALIDYADYSIVLGVLMSLGAIFGDLVKSYFKRKHHINPGEPWPVWDQLDFVIGGIIFSFFVYVPSIEVVVVLLIASPILHVAVNYIGYLLGISKAKF